MLSGASPSHTLMDKTIQMWEGLAPDSYQYSLNHLEP